MRARDARRGDPQPRRAVCTIVAMAYDQELAGRIRQVIGSDPELTEKKMFGGLAFLIRGNMAIAASSGGGVMVRVDPDPVSVAVTKKGLKPVRIQPEGAGSQPAPVMLVTVRVNGDGL